jgi:3-methyladenine DNA glycosylase AlkD
MTIQEQIQNIKQQLRSVMNGVAAASMREKGAGYRMNFGVELPRLKEIAADFPKDHDLAQALWKEEGRECKILATLLQPTERFDSEFVDLWMETMPTVEVMQYAVMHLFQYLPCASEKAFEWMASEKVLYQTAAYTLLGRLFMQGAELSERSEQEFVDQAIAAWETDNLALKKAILSAAEKYEGIKEIDILSQFS